MVAAATLTEMVGGPRHRLPPHGTCIGAAPRDGGGERTLPGAGGRGRARVVRALRVSAQGRFATRSALRALRRALREERLQTSYLRLHGDALAGGWGVGNLPCLRREVLVHLAPGTHRRCQAASPRRTSEAEKSQPTIIVLCLFLLKINKNLQRVPALRGFWDLKKKQITS